MVRLYLLSQHNPNRDEGRYAFLVVEDGVLMDEGTGLVTEMPSHLVTTLKGAVAGLKQITKGSEVVLIGNPAILSHLQPLKLEISVGRFPPSVREVITEVKQTVVKRHLSLRLDKPNRQDGPFVAKVSMLLSEALRA